MARGRPGSLKPEQVDQGLLDLVNQYLMAWGYEGEVKLTDGVLRVSLSGPVLCVRDGWVKKRWRIKPSVAKMLMRASDPMLFAQMVMTAYFGKLMCHFRDKEIEWASVSGSGNGRKGRRARNAG